jgi:iron complex transport system permease protein
VTSGSLDAYRTAAARRTAAILTAIGLLGVTLAADSLIGPALLSVRQVISAIIAPAFGGGDATTVIVWTLRLPMACMAIMVGAALGAAGAEVQTILDNPIADPYTLGLSASAGFGAAATILFGRSIPLDPVYAATLAAFCCSLAAGLTILAVARRQPTIETMILTGIALLFLFQALLSLLQYLASPEALQAIVFWLFGSLARASWPKVGVVAAVLAVILPFLARDAWRLTALRLGEERAKSLGVNVAGLRVRIFATIALLTAVAVSFVGTIGFVGLVAPHVARMLVGEDQRYLLPMSAICGALFLSAASVASKSINPGGVFPIGIVTSLIGVPFFFSLVLKTRRGYW